MLILVAGGAEIAKNETMQGGEARNGEYWKGCNWAAITPRNKQSMGEEAKVLHHLQGSAQEHFPLLSFVWIWHYRKAVEKEA